MDKLKVFIAHSGSDAPVVELLVDLIRLSLNLPARDIRATSVNGCKLPSGADTNNQLKAEVQDAEVLIGLISERSVGSIYAVCELGNRWGTDKPLIPLLAPGASRELLKKPLSELNSLTCANRADLCQLVTDLGKYLGVTPESSESYLRQIDALMASVPPPTTPEPLRSTKSPTEPGSEEFAVMQYIGTLSQEDITVGGVSEELKISPVRAECLLNRLAQRRLLQVAYAITASNQLPRYKLTSKGSDFLLDNGLC